MNKDTEVCDRILRSVICRVEQFEVTRSHRRSIAYKAICLLAIIALVPAIYYLEQSSSQSGFGRYISLISSDGSYVMLHLRDFLMSAASSLPISATIATILILFIIATTIRRTVRYSEYFREHKEKIDSITSMTFKEFTQSKDFSKIVYIIGGILVALLIFQAGIFVGYRVADFSIDWDSSHEGNIHSPLSIFAPFGRDMDDMNPHGAVGEIISVELPVIMVKGPSGNEAIILVSSTTAIRNMRNPASPSDLKVGSQIVTIGTPDAQGRIEATFIRVVPELPQSQPNNK